MLKPSYLSHYPMIGLRWSGPKATLTNFISANGSELNFLSNFVSSLSRIIRLSRLNIDFQSLQQQQIVCRTLWPTWVSNHPDFPSMMCLIEDGPPRMRLRSQKHVAGAGSATLSWKGTNAIIFLIWPKQGCSPTKGVWLYVASNPLKLKTSDLGSFVLKEEAPQKKAKDKGFHPKTTLACNAGRRLGRGRLHGNFETTSNTYYQLSSLFPSWMDGFGFQRS